MSLLLELHNNILLSYIHQENGNLLRIAHMLNQYGLGQIFIGSSKIVGCRKVLNINTKFNRYSSKRLYIY